jgi:hypothetical protein
VIVVIKRRHGQYVLFKITPHVVVTAATARGGLECHGSEENTHLSFQK